MKHIKIGQCFLNDGLLSESQLAYAVAYQMASGGATRLGSVLVEQGFVDSRSVAVVLAKQAGWQFYSGPYVSEDSVVNSLESKYWREHSVFPLKGKGGLSFVMPDSGDVKVTDILTARFGGGIQFLIGVESEIVSAINKLCCEDDRSLKADYADIKQMILDAMRQGASDIHIEPSATTVNVRFRVDGVLHFSRALPRSELSRVINICFNRAGISAGDFMHFHDGRFEEECDGRKLDIRLSHIPSVSGSSIVLRLLDKSRSAVPLSELGYAPEHIEQLLTALRRPHGLLLFTGPTGCGKTTSLYSLLNELKGLDIKVVTAEDPVEVRMPMVTQVTVDNRKEQDFHHITRALLRHDPDIIMIGEIRDEKTAREAVRAAVTGHRVLATLHTNDVMSALLRLHDLGIDLHQISHTLTCVVSQRLIRVLCPYCKEMLVGSNEYTACGCKLCLGGYRKRTVVAETLLINEEMRSWIDRGLFQEMAVNYKTSSGRLTIRADAERQLREGVVSREEIERVLG